MALFIDGQINGLHDLERYESGLLGVTSTEQIDLTAKMALAQDLTAADLLLFLLRQNSADPPNPLFTGQAGTARRRLGVSDVVVTDPLQRWHALRSIELTYRDAFNNQLNDRYRGKRDQYQKLALEAAEQLYQVGVGLTSDPVGKAAAPLLMAVGGGMMAANFCVRMAWVNRAGQEGEPSEVAYLQTVDNTQLLVSPMQAPPNAAGWNVYVGQNPESVSLQNAAPLRIGADWTLPFGSLRLGRIPGNGQAPERFAVNDRRIQRG